jgi:hypothetical protein
MQGYPSPGLPCGDAFPMMDDDNRRRKLDQKSIYNHFFFIFFVSIRFSILDAI